MLFVRRRKVYESETGDKNKSCDELVTEICQLMEDGRSLVVVDGLSAKEEWDQVKSCLQTKFGTDASCTVIVTTTSVDVASHCSGHSTFKLKLSPLDSAAIHQLFYQKYENEVYACAVCTPYGLLCTKTRTSAEWEKLLKRLDLELEKNPDHGVASTAAKLSYDDLPSHMKYCVQYLSIFPRRYTLMLRRLANAWLAETFWWNTRGDNAEEVKKIFDALVTSSMVHPLNRVEITSGKMNVCHIDDVFRELWFSEAKFGGFIRILDEHTLNNLTNTQIRHLVVTSGWARDDDQFTKLDLSCARSLTVSGKWSSCFISPSMKLLRVLDLQDTKDLLEHHDLEHIGEFRHLKYLGLRNTGIAHLPNSLGKLQRLEELDIRGTYIDKLPYTVVHLTRLCRLRGGVNIMAACNPQPEFDSEMTRGCPGLLKDSISSALCMRLLSVSQRHKPYGVCVPQKIGELKSLVTMGTIDAAGSRTVMKEIQKLTQLEKLGVMGVTERNSKHLCTTLERLDHLRSLMVHSDNSLMKLDTVTSPPRHLETLKLYGNLGTLPRWFKSLHGLVNLCLRGTLLKGDAVQIIAKLPKLIILRLLAKSLVIEEMAFQSDALPNLELLQLDQLENLMSISFQRGAVPNLEILQVYNCNFLSKDSLRPFYDLPRIKKVLLDGMLVLKQAKRTGSHLSILSFKYNLASLRRRAGRPE
ncbi:hypothetical protein HU200_038312 [Digitaria exilis]|uniref:NB-ARC domain-containing protein n=1 Tax=Digitaria exilis TaxID=1010633 RepID=A0A835EJ74_9POAL|nr:hypothetical protein HU200_038312 [Digitaria exilis]